MMARKGLWAPTPAFEIGAGGSYLVDSTVFALQAYAKLAVHEGFHKLPVPSIALRAAVSRPFGLGQVDMTLISTDLSISKSFGVAGTFKLDPYLGANLLVNIIKSQVIDTTPNTDAYRQGAMSLDLNANATFPDQDAILRWRLFAGLRFVYSLLAITGEFAWTTCNASALDCAKENAGKVTDRSDHQYQLSISAGLVF
jgi:hypothetical protein